MNREEAINMCKEMKHDGKMIDRSKTSRKWVIGGMLVAVGVVLSPVSIPVGGARCFPIQHMMNVIAAVWLGPWYGAAMAFVTSCIRIMLGSGSFLAFPGSMIGAMLSGLAYRYGKRLIWACVGEVAGTGILGSLAAYPVAVFIMGREAAVLGYVIPFGVSTLGGTFFAMLLTAALRRVKHLDSYKE